MKKDQTAFNLLPESSSQNETCYDQVLEPRRENSANGSAFFTRAAVVCSASMLFAKRKGNDRMFRFMVSIPAW